MRTAPVFKLLWGTWILAVLCGCFALRPSRGGGQTAAPAQRKVDPADVLVPPGFRIEALATGLTFPVGVAFDDEGRPVVLESGYSYGEVFTRPRLVRIGADGAHHPLLEGEGGPWTGIAHHQGNFYVADGNVLGEGRLLRISPANEVTVVVDGLPSMGDHHVNGPSVGPDGALYFGVGTATNSGVVGPDNLKFGWLSRRPDFHDIPCQDIELTGEAAAFMPHGSAALPGQKVEGRVPCSGALFKVSPAGGALELVAWGFRNPFGLAFHPDQTLYVTDNGYDRRGSRPVYGAPDLLWRVEQGRWYGWPDHSGTRRLDYPRGQGGGAGPIRPVIATDLGTPPEPAAHFGVHSSSNGFDFSVAESFGHPGEAFVAQFGDMAPEVGKVLNPVGFRVVRVEVQTGVIHDFAVNRKANGPASKLGTGGLERPTAARFDPSGKALYVVDFGVMTVGREGPAPLQGTGVLWRILREGDR